MNTFVVSGTLMAAAILTPLANSQPDGKGGCKKQPDLLPVNFSSWTFYGAGNLAANASPSEGLKRSKGFEAGAGHAVIPRSVRTMTNACLKPMRRWTILLQTNFLYNESDLEPAVIQQAIISNPQNVALLAAHSGSAKYLSWTFDPTLQVLGTNHARLYFFGGAGWFRRNIGLSGVPSQGSLIQTSNPGVFGSSGNSVGIDGGFGFDVGRPRSEDGPRLSDIRFYFEVRVIHGLAINQGTTLVPVSAGVRW